MSVDEKPKNPLPSIKPETIAAIQADKFAMAVINATREFLMVAHRDFSRFTKDGKMIFEHDEAGIAWAGLGVIAGTEFKESDLPSDTTVNVGGVCMNIGTIDMLGKALRDGAKRRELANA